MLKLETLSADGGAPLVKAREVQPELALGVLTGRGPWSGSAVGMVQWGSLRFNRLTKGETQVRFVTSRSRAIDVEGRSVALSWSGGELKQVPGGP